MTARNANSKPNRADHSENAFAFGRQPLAPWSALAPFAAQAARSALIGMDGCEAALKSWRGLIDASRAMIREQQDMMLRGWRVQLAEAAGEQGAQAGAQQDLLWPVSTALKSYEQVTDAVLQAQRGALEAISRSAEMH